jgi:hypothetical protein
MNTKADLSNKKKINELAIGHNKLTTLVACLLNEVTYLKKELNDLKGNDITSQTSRSLDNNVRQQNSNNNMKYSNFNELRAEDILKQLSINNPDN